MKLYARIDGESITHPTAGEILINAKDRSVTVDQELADELHRIHINGKPIFEDEAEKDVRLAAEEKARREDPATLLAEVEKLNAKFNEKPKTGAQLRAEAEALIAEAEAAEAAEKPKRGPKPKVTE